MFKEVLQELKDRTEGCLGVLIMGTDGIAVEKVWQPEAATVNLNAALAEYTALLKNAKRINNEIGLGSLKEITLKSENGIIIMRLVSDEYFIAMVLSPDGNLGRGRYELGRAELILANDFIY
jgi:predicted regulator of Ras-like GTPase activity (Roadblock/LC7/MglB family)